MVLIEDVEVVDDDALGIVAVVAEGDGLCERAVSPRRAVSARVVGIGRKADGICTATGEGEVLLLLIVSVAAHRARAV